tara:strand:- start:3157 stop:3495 length:339 start_codon:yes stop_codon:yes gene_type:complete
MLISESAVRSFIRSILFESDEKVYLSEISFSPDPHHFEGSHKKNVSGKYTVYDTHGPESPKKHNKKKKDKKEVLLDDENNPIKASEIVEESFSNDHIYKKIVEVKNKITGEH